MVGKCFVSFVSFVVNALGWGWDVLCALCLSVVNLFLYREDHELIYRWNYKIIFDKWKYFTYIMNYCDVIRKMVMMVAYNDVG